MTDPLTTTSAPPTGNTAPHASHASTGLATPTTTASGKDTGTPGGKRSRQVSGFRKCFLLILCFILPPLAVGIEDGFGFQLFLNIVLLILGWIPAVVHSLFIIFV